MKLTNLNLSKYRKEFPFTDKIIYLNHASFGPLPQRSWKATEDYYKHLRLEKLKDMDKVAFEKLDEIRVMVAEMIKANPAEIAFATNTSYGLNVAAWGLDLKPGDRVLLPDVEFPANTYPWTNLRQKGVVVDFIPSKNRCFDMDSFLNAIDSKTRVLSLSFVQFFNGFKIDLRGMERSVRKRISSLWWMEYRVSGIWIWTSKSARSISWHAARRNGCSRRWAQVSFISPPRPREK
jgi:cysteine desulfurase/selenocysteine lyase